MSKLTVYEYKGFPNPARVRIALAEKGLFEAAEFVQVDVPNGGHRTPAFLKRNPSGVVPVLELADGAIISECTAITEYLDHIAGEPTLTGMNAKERGVIAMVQRKIETGLLDASATFFHHATPGLGPEIEIYQNKEWGEKQRENAVLTMHWLETQLDGKDFVAADRFTVADITAMAGFAFAGFAKIEVPAELGRVQAWRDRVSERPSAALAF